MIRQQNTHYVFVICLIKVKDTLSIRSIFNKIIFKKYFNNKEYAKQ